MSRRTVSAAAGIAVSFDAAHIARAHHSFAAEFDAAAQADLDGEITEVWFNNPHVRYRLAVRSDDGTLEQWELQASSVTALQQLGWTAQTLSVGDHVKVSGQLGRNGAKKLFIRGVERPDGSQLRTGRNDPNARDPNVVTADPAKR